MRKFFPLLRPHVLFISETWLPPLLEDLIYYRILDGLIQNIRQDTLLIEMFLWTLGLRISGGFVQIYRVL